MHLVSRGILLDQESLLVVNARQVDQHWRCRDLAALERVDEVDTRVLPRRGYCGKPVVPHQLRANASSPQASQGKIAGLIGYGAPRTSCRSALPISPKHGCTGSTVS